MVGPRLNKGGRVGSDGWIKIHRRLLNNKVYQHDPTAWRIFFHLLLIIDKDTGSVDIGRFQLARELKISPDTLYSSLLRLSQNHKMVNIKSNNQFSTIHIQNWKKYQAVNTSINNQSTTNQQPINTIQELRIKKDISKDISVKPKTFGNKNINQIMETFKKCFGQTHYPLKEQRRYCNTLLRNYSLKRILKAINYTNKISDDKYAPRISSPKGLHYKWNDLEIYARQHKPKKTLKEEDYD